MRPNILYLHGFASSPGGTKASAFRERLAARGLTLHVPDLNVPDFEHLTLTAMIEAAAEAVRQCPPGPVYLIGSSLGGFTALHFLDRRRAAEAQRVERLVLIAPALAFLGRHSVALGAEVMAQWQARGWLPVYHDGYQRQMRLRHDLVEDLRDYSGGFDVALDIPTLIFHGRRDESVDYRLSERFARDRDNVTLRLFDSDHRLLDCVDAMWEEMVVFFDL